MDKKVLGVIQFVVMRLGRGKRNAMTATRYGVMAALGKARDACIITVVPH